MKTYKQPPPWPNDPQQWDTRHDIRRFLEDAMGHAGALYADLEELQRLDVVTKEETDRVGEILHRLSNIYYGEEED